MVAYAFIFGWGYAVGFYGAAVRARDGPFASPRAASRPQRRCADVHSFLGAWIRTEGPAAAYRTRGLVGLGGPLIGTVGALVVYFLARSYDSTLLLAVAYSGFFLNLFNMIPLSPFDGGRITAVLSPRIWFLGVPVLVGLFVWRPARCLS